MDARNGRSSSWGRLLLLLVGLLLVVSFAWRVGISAIGRELGRLGPSAVLIVLPYAVGTSIAAWPWARLLPAALRPGLGATVASRFAASGSNALLPFFGVAGEPTRLLWLAPEARARGLAAIVVDRVLYNSASALLLLLAALAAGSTRLSADLRTAAGAIAILTLLATLTGGWIVARAGVGQKLSRILRKLLGSTRDHGFGAEVDQALQQFLTRDRAALGSGLLLHFAGRAAMAAETYVALRSLQAPTTLAEALVLAAAPIASAFFASSIPSQLGVQEGVLALTCHALGLSAVLGITLALLIRLRQLVFVSLTPILLTLPDAKHQRVRPLETHR
jgi:hypothetical protein